MAVNPLPNLGTQLERAIRAWLVQCGAGVNNDIFTSNDSRERSGLFETGLTDLLAHYSDHSPEFTGSEVYQVKIQIKFGGVIQPGQSNPELNRILIDKRVGMMLSAMMQTTNGQIFDATVQGISVSGRALKTSDDKKVANDNQDMADFTCQIIRYLGASRGQPEDGSCAWVEERRFEITACSINAD